jgi:hypothetical protein
MASVFHKKALQFSPVVGLHLWPAADRSWRDLLVRAQVARPRRIIGSRGASGRAGPWRLPWFYLLKLTSHKLEKLIFRQDPERGAETYVLEESRLIIAPSGVGVKNERVIPLWKISPDFGRAQKRNYRFVLIPLLPVAALLGLGWWLSMKNIVPLEMGIGFALFLAAGLIWSAFRGFSPIEASGFTDRTGEKLAEIYRPGKGSLAIEYEEFVAALSTRIKAVRASEKDVYKDAYE